MQLLKVSGGPLSARSIFRSVVQRLGNRLDFCTGLTEHVGISGELRSQRESPVLHICSRKDLALRLRPMAMVHASKGGCAAVAAGDEQMQKVRCKPLSSPGHQFLIGVQEEVALPRFQWERAVSLSAPSLPRRWRKPAKSDCQTRFLMQHIRPKVGWLYVARSGLGAGLAPCGPIHKAASRPPMRSTSAFWSRFARRSVSSGSSMLCSALFSRV